VKPSFSTIHEQLDRAHREFAEFEAADASIAASHSWLRAALRTFVVISICSGLERVLQTIAKDVDGRMPSGRDWHKRLLAQMAALGPDRPPVLSAETLALLNDLRRFRHLARHHHPSELDEEGIAQNLAITRRILPLFERDLRAFEDTLSKE
jgi:hypothetical protein